MEASQSPVESPHYQPQLEYPDPGGLRPENPGQEIEMLRAQADTMMAELQTINARISVLQGGNAPAPTVVADTGVRRKTSNAMRGGRMTAIVDKEECVSCGICVGVCPEEAITVEDTAVINPQKCTGCGLCVDECPNESISLVKLEVVAL
jgi:NAD-dependent dihydropyrimidine dehydrogenase PreA subunit